MSNYENEKNADIGPLYVENFKRECFRKEVSADFVLPVDIVVLDCLLYVLRKHALINIRLG